MNRVCDLCGRPARGGWCRGRAIPWCNYRARLALGIQRWEALRLLERDKAGRP